MVTPADSTLQTTITIQKTLLRDAERLATQLNLSPNHLFERALEDFITNHQNAPRRDTVTVRAPAATRSRVINQGDLYWTELESQSELDSGVPHPYVVVQDNLFNHSRIHTVVVCALTSNIKRISDTPGNVLLEAGEANLPKQSVVEVSKVSTVEKSQLGEYIGALSAARVAEILAGMRFLQLSSFGR